MERGMTKFNPNGVAVEARPWSPAARRRRSGLNFVLAFAVALPSALVAWPHLGDAARGWRDVVETGGREPPLVLAPSGAIKVAPLQDTADRKTDSVREILAGEADVDVVLLGEPEQPILPPAAAETEAAETEADQPEAALEASRPERREQSDATRPITAAASQDEPRRPDARLELESPPPIVRRAAFRERQEEVAETPPPVVRFHEAAGYQAGERVYRIQIAALPNESDARQTWANHRRAHMDLLGELQPVIEQGETGTYTFYRVQAGAFATLAEAQATCRKLAQRETECVVVRR